MGRTAEHNAKIAASMKARGVGSTPEKVCPRCKQSLPRSEYKQRNGATESYCRPCQRAYNAERQRRYFERHPERREQERANNRRAQYKRKYGITIEDYEAMLAAQDGRCGICSGPPSRKYFSVDHCHDSGRVRGLLCDPCNLSIGKFRDDTDLMRAAIKYVEAHR